jgi:hypothetical protein
MSLAQCAAQTYTCLIEAPALYAQVEAQPWGGFNVPYNSVASNQGPTSSQHMAVVEDLRYGVPQWFFNQSVPWDGRHGSWPSFSMSSISAPSGLNAHMAGSMQLLNFDYAGYRNSFNNASGMGDKVDISTFALYQYKYAQMQGGGAMGLALDGFGDGDNVGITMDLLGYGGPNTSSDEGTEGHRESVGEGGQVFSATVSGIAVGADGSETISTTSQTYNGYQGEGRLLIDLSQGYNGVANGNYIALTATTGGVGVITCGGTCNWDSSFGDSVQTTLTAKVGNGTSSTNTFPQSNAVLQVASTPGFAVGNLACIFDYDYECENITAVGAGTVTIATARLPHPVGAYVTSGGLTGYAVEFEADRVVPGNALISGLPDSAISSTIRAAWPVMYNSSGNKAALFTGGNYIAGASGFPASRVYPAMGSGISIAITVSGGTITACTPSGGSGYTLNAPPAIVFASTGSPTTAPAAHLTGIYGATTFNTCVIDNPGVGVSSTATASAPSVNAYDFYPAAKTYLVYNASTGTVDGTFWTEPFAGTIAASDSVEQPHYFWQNAREENLSYGSIIPTLSSDASSGIGISHVGAGQGQDTEISISNTANSALYQGYPTGTPWVAGYGQLLAPYGINMSGAHTFFGKMSQPPLPGAGYAGFVLGVGCGTIGCASWTAPYSVLSVSGNGGTDALNYTPFSRTWALGGTEFDISLSGCTYKWTSTGATTTCATTSALPTNPINQPSGGGWKLAGTLTFTGYAQEATLHAVGANNSSFIGFQEGSVSEATITVISANGGGGTVSTPNLAGVVGHVEGVPGFLNGVTAVEHDGGVLATNEVWDIYTLLGGAGNFTLQPSSGATWVPVNTAATPPTTAAYLVGTLYQRVGAANTAMANGLNVPTVYGSMNFAKVPAISQPLTATEVDGSGTFVTGTPYYFTVALSANTSCTQTDAASATYEKVFTPTGTNPSVTLSISRFQNIAGAAAWLIGEGTTSGGEARLACVPFPQAIYVVTGLGSPSGAMPATDTSQGSITYNGSAPSTTVNGQTCSLGGTCTVPLPLSGTTGSIGGSALVAGACTSGTVAVAGSTTAMAVPTSPAIYPGDGMFWHAYVSTAGTVTVKVCASIAGTPTASTYNVRVIQ